MFRVSQATSTPVLPIWLVYDPNLLLDLSGARLTYSSDFQYSSLNLKLAFHPFMRSLCIVESPGSICIVQLFPSHLR